MSLKPESYQLHLGSQFLNVHLNPSHELVILADRIDWDSLVYKLKRFFQKHGRKAKRIRLMVGLLFLKHLHNLSDRLVVGMVHENIYYKYLCGLQWDLSEWASDVARWSTRK